MQVGTDNEIIDLVMRSLFERPDRYGLCLKAHILKPNKLEDSREEVHRISKLILQTGFVISANEKVKCGGVDFSFSLSEAVLI